MIEFYWLLAITYLPTRKLTKQHPIETEKCHRS